MIQPRRIPISKDVHELLQSYLHSEERREVSTQNVFVSRHGRPLRVHWVMNAFARLRVRAGVIRIDGGKCPPRMRDLRQKFAVHRIASWIKEGADLNRMLPALSAYMGLAGVVSTQRFLFLTPERFKRELDKLSPFKGRKQRRPGLDDLSRQSLGMAAPLSPSRRECMAARARESPNLRSGHISIKSYILDHICQ